MVPLLFGMLNAIGNSSFANHLAYRMIGFVRFFMSYTTFKFNAGSGHIIVGGHHGRQWKPALSRLLSSSAINN